MNLDSAKPLVYLITAGQLTDRNYLETFSTVIQLIKQAAKAGVQLVQLREKSLSAGKLFDLAERAVDVTIGTTTKVLVNDRLDVALAAGCAGVHLTSMSLPASSVRERYGNEILIAASVHDIDELLLVSNHADFAVFGPVFDTPGKRAKGIADLRKAVDAVRPFPVLALGGLNESNLLVSLEAGVAGIAAIRLLNDPSALTRVAKLLDL